MTRAIVTLALVSSLYGCGRRTAIVVASKNFTESVILGEIAAQQIERKTQLEVERKLNLGGTLLAHEAIKGGDIDIYPEYTGTALTVVLKTDAPPDPAQSYEKVKAQYLRRFNLVWLPPLGFDDTFAMVVRSSDAKKLRAQKISSATSRKWRLGIGYEFLTRPDGLQKLNQTYHLRWEDTPVSMDLGLLYQALAQGTVDMAAANSTDAKLTDPKFSILEDDRHAFPPYNACYIIRKELAAQRPAIVSALTMLSNRIDEGTMREMNRRVDIDHRPVEQVARDFLAQQP